MAGLIIAGLVILGFLLFVLYCLWQAVKNIQSEEHVYSSTDDSDPDFDF